MRTPNSKEIEALLRLLNDRDFDTFIQWIERSSLEQAVICAKDITDNVKVEQGRFLELEDMRKLISNKDRLEKTLEVLKKTKT